MAIIRLGALRFAGLNSDVGSLPIDVNLDGAIFDATDTTQKYVSDGTQWTEFVSATGEDNTGANVGVGTGTIFRDKTGVTLNFKSLIGGTNIDVIDNADDITISSTGTSPLTTKGDIYGFSTVDARLPVGTDGQILSANDVAANGLGLEWIDNVEEVFTWTANHDMNGFAAEDSKFADGTDPTKILALDLLGMTTGITLTLQSIQSSAQTLLLPNITQSDTIVTEKFPQTLASKTLDLPIITDFTNAVHDHVDAAGGGTLLSTAALSDTADIAYLNTPNTFLNSITLDSVSSISITTKSDATASMIQRSFSDTANPDTVLSRSRGSEGAETALQSGDIIGELQYTGHDGTIFTQGAGIQAVVNGVPTLLQMPSDLVFFTSNGPSILEGFRILNDQSVKLSGELDASTNKLINVVDPTLDQDAATKKYVDDSGGGATFQPAYQFAVATDILETGLVSNVWRLPFDFTSLASMTAYVEETSSGADITMDIKKAGVTEATIVIAAGSLTGNTSTFTSGSIADTDEITVEITQIGSGATGSNLKISIIEGAISSSKSIQFAATTVQVDLAVETIADVWRTPTEITTITEINAYVEVAPVGSAIILDVKKDGVTEGTVTISDGAFTGSTAILTSGTIDFSNQVTVEITQVGSTTPGQNLKVNILGS